MNKQIAILIIATLCSQLTALDPTLWPRQDQPCLSQYGWFWDGQKCETCFNKQCICSVYNGCSSCQSGYFLRQDSAGNWFCDSCNGGLGRSNIQNCCPIYNSNNVLVDYHATKCFDNIDSQAYMLYGSYCQFISKCTSYSDYGRCQTCAKGYFLNEQSICILCSSNAQCTECQDINTCTQCIAGYYLAQYKGSSSTDASDTLSNASKCKACDTNCICTDGTVSKCTDCLPDKKQNGFYYDSGASKCTSCIANCLTCSDNVKCSKCQDQFTIDNTGKCTACPGNCQSCSYDSTNSVSSCNSNSCFNNYFEYKADATKPTVTCQQCPDTNAFRCKGSDGKTNTLCQYLSDDTSYKAPHTSAYYLVNGDNNVLTCIKNDNNCKSMNSKGKCDTCYSDLGWLKTTSSICKQCQVEKPNCLNCSPNQNDGLDCIACPNSIEKSDYVVEYSNYFLEQTSKGCKGCAVGCLNCQSESVCNQCQRAYTLNSNKGCDKCQITNCQNCDGNVNSCRVCFVGFRIWNNPTSDPTQVKCESCESNCKLCDSNRKICTQCNDKYYLVNGVCKITKRNCVNQRDDGPCMICAYGFRQVGGWCFSCASTGYINCPQLCTNMEYTRDGDLLTATYEKTRYPATNLARLTAGIIAIVMIICAILI